MKVALTGATGFIGSHVLEELCVRGHEVVALVSDDVAAARVADQATPLIVDLDDWYAVGLLLDDTDAAIHTSPSCATVGAEVDEAVVDAAIHAFNGSGRAYIHLSGIWISAMNRAVTEQFSSDDAPLIVSWNPPLERRVLHARDMRGVVITTNADEQGAGQDIFGPLRDARPRFVTIEQGLRLSSPVSVADLAALLRVALEHPSARGRYVVGNGVYATVTDRDPSEVLVLEHETAARSA